MIRKTAFKRTIAYFFLILLSTELLLPATARALTSGPSQPETKQFSPASVSDMVDLFTGDLRYNIPLLDVDGYPINLNYASGIGMDDEASWVGLGWNLNVGAVTRQLRGLPDDLSGDVVETEHYLKPRVTTGGKFTGRVEFAGIEAFKELKMGGSFSLGLFYDNYTGYGAEVGANSGISLSMGGSTPMTAGLNSGITSNTGNGVSLSHGASLGYAMSMDEKAAASISGSATLGYNTREGLKDLSLGTSFSVSSTDEEPSKVFNQQTRDAVKGDQSVPFYNSYGSGNAHGSSSVSFNTPPFYPASKIPYRNTSRTFSLDIGGAIYVVDIGAGITGYKSMREVLTPVTTNYAYGALYAEKGKNDKNALMDFLREKENVVVPGLRQLPLPVATSDLFSYSSQAGGGQFKVYGGSSGVVFDNTVEDISDNKTLGTDYGWGLYFHGGVSLFDQAVKSRTRKWKNGNHFLNYGDYPQPAESAKDEESAYFKQVGELSAEDAAYLDRIQGEEAVRIPLSKKEATSQLKANGKAAVDPLPGGYKKQGRQIRRTPVMYLTAKQANKTALEKKIKSYPFNNQSTFIPKVCEQLIPSQSIDRVSGFRKDNHLSEITVQGDDGKRMVYGIPVYNIKQEEYSFAVNSANPNANRDNNQIPVEYGSDGKIKHKHPGTNDFYYRESQPAYATSYLLTAVLSPDYVDVTGNGISDDDRGTAYKFNYSKLENDYQWRSPFPLNMATWNRGLLADPDDDKGSFVYGKKEMWYLHSVESKTKIAYFITDDRDDALGVIDWKGGKNTNVRQKRLKEIRLYAKNNLETPIKTVVLNYSYTLCTKVPNQAVDNTGKLTLDSVYFKYGSSDKGANHPYIFEYDKMTGTSFNEYAYQSTDRWGTFKLKNGNLGGLRNDEFPYSHGSLPLWHLKRVTLPTGGKIDIAMTSDTYSYVQDKKGMNMLPLPQFLDKNGAVTLNIMDAKRFRFNFNVPGLTKELFKEKILSGSDYLYAKIFANVSDEPNSTDENKYDWVPCYAQVKEVSPAPTGGTDVEFVSTRVGNEDINPFVIAIWEKMRNDYPRYAYPGYNNKIPDTEPVDAAVQAIGSAMGNLNELWENFYKRAYRKGFGKKIVADKSFVRRFDTNTNQVYGGGLAVSVVTLTDQWSEGAGTLSQFYDYRDATGSTSSGVASYEPSLGGDQNPLRQPDPYTQRNIWALSNHYYLEKPFGEALYPAPSVGYSRVKVINGGDASPFNQKSLGFEIYEFYTAKDFPVEVVSTDLERYDHSPVSFFGFFGGRKVSELGLSQGYAIRLNDMHGKPKAVRFLDYLGNEVSATEYFYNAEDIGNYQRVVNKTDVVDENGKIYKDQVLGREVDLFADMRESETINTGTMYALGVDVIPILQIPIPLPHTPVGINDEYRLFRSASVTKTIQYYGMLKKMVKKINGSSISSTYLVHDKYTGEPVVSQVENEFKDPVYSMTIPAWWTNKTMGLAYKNLNMLMPEFSISEDGTVDARYRSYLIAGDELRDLNNEKRLWVINTQVDGSTIPAIKIIDETGKIVKFYNGDLKIMRSGNRNFLKTPGTTLTCLVKPYDNTRLKGIAGEEHNFLQVLDAKTTLFSEEWGQPTDCNQRSCPPGYFASLDGAKCLKIANELAPNGGGLRIVKAPAGYHHYSLAAWFYNPRNIGDPTGTRIGFRNTGFWRAGDVSSPLGGRLTQSGIWVESTTTNKWYRIEKTIDLPSGKDYCIGYGVDDGGVLKVGIFWQSVSLPQGGTNSNSTEWKVEPINVGGKVKIVYDFINNQALATAGFEIYENTITQLMDQNNIKVVYSSKDLVQDHNYNAYELDNNHNPVKTLYTCDDGSPALTDDTRPYCSPYPINECPPGFIKAPDGINCVTQRTEQNNMKIEGALGDANYSIDGALVYNSAGTIIHRRKNCFYGGSTEPPIPPGGAGPSAATWDDWSAYQSVCGRLNNTGIWLNDNGSRHADTKIGVRVCVAVPVSKTYYIGYAADYKMDITIDGQLWQSTPQGTGDNHPSRNWHIKERFLTAGTHELQLEGTMKPGPIQDFYGSMGLDIYNSSLQEITSGYQPEILFSTAQLATLGSTYPYDTYWTYWSAPANSILTERRYICSDGSKVNVCNNMQCTTLDMSPTINPYLTGYLGNWGGWQDKVYLTPRSTITVANSTGGAVRKGGTYTSFTPYWLWNINSQKWEASADPNWVTARSVVLVDQYSQVLENKNALNIPSAARYGYKETMPLIVGSNARYRELFFDGFEDYKFNKTCNPLAICRPDEFDIHKIVGTNYASWINAEEAHTGNYSLKLDAPLHLRAYTFNNEHNPGIYLGLNSNGEYFRKKEIWMGMFGFNPMRDRQYIVSFWVRDRQATKTAAVKVMINGVERPATYKATVEGWKLMECTFNAADHTSSDMDPVNVELSSTGSNVLIDDLRIFPQQGQAATYVYDDRTLKLMAELDANNFATLYEYDDEGTLIRQKKETERGIITIKENRSALRKN